MNEVIAKLKTHYESLFPEDKGVSQEELDSIEKKLEVTLPRDFRDIASFYSGGMIGGQSIYTITSDPNNEYGISNRTIVFREAINLPQKILPLYFEYGFIYMDLDDHSKNYKKVIYCATEEAQSLCESAYPQNVYRVYSSFTDFFEYLIEQEEKDRQQK